MSRHSVTATLRHRELTQELFDIGDEIATYIENLVEAVEDWDAELVEDCSAEFDEILTAGVVDSRRIVAELVGLRRALVSGLKGGSLSLQYCGANRQEVPEMLASEKLQTRFPLEDRPVVIAELAGALDARTLAVSQNLRAVVEWELEQTEHGARELDRVKLPKLYEHVGRLVHAATDAWLTSVAYSHPTHTRAMRGRKPPEFLAERARIDAVVARVIQRRRQAQGAASNGTAC